MHIKYLAILANILKIGTILVSFKETLTKSIFLVVRTQLLHSEIQQNIFERSKSAYFLIRIKWLSSVHQSIILAPVRKLFYIPFCFHYEKKKPVDTFCKLKILHEARFCET